MRYAVPTCLMSFATSTTCRRCRSCWWACRMLRASCARTLGFLRHRRRVTRWVEAGALALDELKRVAEELCEVTVGERLLERLHEESRGNMGLAVVGLGAIERVGKMGNASRVTESMMRNVPLLGG